MSPRNSSSLLDAAEITCVGMNMGDSLPEPSSALVIGLDINRLENWHRRHQGCPCLYSALWARGPKTLDDLRTAADRDNLICWIYMAGGIIN